MAVETAERRDLVRFVAEQIDLRLAELAWGDRKLRDWFVNYKENYKDGDTRLAAWLVYTSRSREELEEKVGRVLDALPRYLKLVRKILDLEELHEYVTRGILNEVIKVFRYLAPLAHELRETGLMFGPFRRPIYVGEWIQVEDTDVEEYLGKRNALEFIVRLKDRLAEHIEDEDKRERFLRLVELAKKLNFNPGGVCAGEVSTYDYEATYDPILRDYRVSVTPITGRLCVGYPDPSAIQIGRPRLNALAPAILPTLIPIMDEVERLYGRLEEELRRILEHNEGILGQMRRVASPYIVDRIMG